MLCFETRLPYILKYSYNKICILRLELGFKGNMRQNKKRIFYFDAFTIPIL